MEKLPKYRVTSCLEDDYLNSRHIYNACLSSEDTEKFKIVNLKLTRRLNFDLLKISEILYYGR